MEFTLWNSLFGIHSLEFKNFFWDSLFGIQLGIHFYEFTLTLRIKLLRILTCESLTFGILLLWDLFLELHF